MSFLKSNSGFFLGEKTQKHEKEGNSFQLFLLNLYDLASNIFSCIIKNLFHLKRMTPLLLRNGVIQNPFNKGD